MVREKLRARKQVDYSDPGELTLAEIRGSSKPSKRTMSLGTSSKKSKKTRGLSLPKSGTSQTPNAGKDRGKTTKAKNTQRRGNPPSVDDVKEKENHGTTTPKPLLTPSGVRTSTAAGGTTTTSIKAKTSTKNTSTRGSKSTRSEATNTREKRRGVNRLDADKGKEGAVDGTANSSGKAKTSTKKNSSTECTISTCTEAINTKETRKGVNRLDGDEGKGKAAGGTNNSSDKEETVTKNSLSTEDSISTCSEATNTTETRKGANWLDGDEGNGEEDLGSTKAGGCAMSSRPLATPRSSPQGMESPQPGRAAALTEQECGQRAPESHGESLRNAISTSGKRKTMEGGLVLNSQGIVNDSSLGRASGLDGVSKRRRQLSDICQTPSIPGKLSDAQEAFLSEIHAVFGAVARSDAEGDLSSVSGAGAGAGDGGAGEVAYWRGCFEELSNLKETEPERRLQDFRAHVAERDRAQRELIEHLSKRNSKHRGSGVGEGGGEREREVAEASKAPGLGEVQEGAAEAGAQSKATVAEVPASMGYVRELESRVAALEANVAAQSTIIRVHQDLSSLVIKLKGKKPGEEEGVRSGGEGSGKGEQDEGMEMDVTCTAVNHVHRRAVQFELRLPREEGGEGEEGGRWGCDGDYLYLPTGNAHLLPPYMKHDLSFTKEQCPLFLTKLLQKLFHK